MSFIFPLLLASVLSFGSPVNYPVSLSGNFGEPRPNHFHGGIDVRTGQVEGKPIFSVADGYVSRITVGLGGFGNAVYVRHPGGITTVYCHLKKFVPQLAAIVRKWQYQNQTCFADVRLRPTDYPVTQGQFIAVSGNTGASKAPHLHLEFHATKTWDFIDPLDYLKGFVTDTTKPIAHSFMAYPVEGEGVFCGSQRNQSYGFSSTNLTREFTAWGKVGFGIWANDYMDGSYGILGIRKTTLTVDGKTVFESVVDSIPSHCNRMVNTWGDYEHYCHSRVWYMKSFADPGNTLPFINVGTADRGIVTFDEERDYHLAYTVSDIFGNSRQYTFTVKGKRQDIPVARRRSVMNMLLHDRINGFQRPGLMLLVPKGLLPDNVELSPKVKAKPDALSDEWRFYDRSYPLLGWAKISLRLKKKVADPSKLYIVSHYGVDRNMGGEFKDGWVTGRMRELGADYEIAYDDIPPVLTSFNASARRLRVLAYDRQSGLRSLKGYVDGRFVLFEYMEKAGVYVCDLPSAPVAKTGGNHTVKLVAVDERGNRSVFVGDFKY
jgi:hypothetical protein